MTTLPNTVVKFTQSRSIQDISVTMPELRSKPLTLSHQEQYDTLKHAARTIDDRFEALVKSSVREHTLSWKPFFKNLATLFGLGYSVVYYCLHKEWPYDDKLVVPPAESQRLVYAEITPPEITGASSSGDNLMDSSRGTCYGSILADGSFVPMGYDAGHASQPGIR